MPKYYVKVKDKESYYHPIKTKGPYNKENMSIYKRLQDARSISTYLINVQIWYSTYYSKDFFPFGEEILEIRELNSNKFIEYKPERFGIFKCRMCGKYFYVYFSQPINYYYVTIPRYLGNDYNNINKNCVINREYCNKCNREGPVEMVFYSMKISSNYDVFDSILGHIHPIVGLSSG